MGAVIVDWLHAELVNWSQWSWSGELPHPLPKGRAASAEGHYLAPSDLGDEPEQPRLRPNVERARIVERVYQTRLSNRERFVLAAEYPRRIVSGRVAYGRAGAARRMRISLAQYEGALRVAARQVELEFDGGSDSLRS